LISINPLRAAFGGSGRFLLYSRLPSLRRPMQTSAVRVLVVEDDAKIASFVAKGLRQEGFAVDPAGDGDTAWALAQATAYDLIVVDVMLPGIDGLELVKRLRAARAEVPVLFLSARSSVEDRVRGLRAGGDDYLTKPFAYAEFSARIQALIRRASRAPEATRLSTGDVTLDLIARAVTVAGRPVELQPREFALLEYLLRHPARPVTKTMILEHVWDYNFDPRTNVVDVLMSRLRSKIDREKTRIETLRGVGYVFRGTT
jgi:two-component system OmpR family response regulator